MWIRLASVQTCGAVGTRALCILKGRGGGRDTFAASDCTAAFFSHPSLL